MIYFATGNPDIKEATSSWSPGAVLLLIVILIVVILWLKRR